MLNLTLGHRLSMENSSITSLDGKSSFKVQSYSQRHVPCGVRSYLSLAEANGID